jgi:[protein-PII] uridylyltransferase
VLQTCLCAPDAQDPGHDDFVIENKRINVADEEVFKRDPVNIIRMFWLADRDGLDFHPDALQRDHGDR